ncbi:MAG: hypothetical protein GYB67_15725 [Chloroflexi bacterium]|nr:hypothetical protein [Chloroflexota bacterium]
MDDFQDYRQQIRLALIASVIVLIVGLIGFMAIEGAEPLDALWLTIVTLSTIGYGDVVAQTDLGRVFTLFLIVIGLSVFAYGLQGVISLLFSPENRERRHRKLAEQLVDRLTGHYILCGSGELVDQTVWLLLTGAANYKAARNSDLRGATAPLRRYILNHWREIHPILRRLTLLLPPTWARQTTPLDNIVIISQDRESVRRLRQNGFIVLDGDPGCDDTMRRAGIERAAKMVIMQDDDTEALLTTLNARTHNPELYITTATLGDDLMHKTLRAGASYVFSPLEITGSFLTTATLRPAVSTFYLRIISQQHHEAQMIALPIGQDSPWRGQTLADLQLEARYDGHVLALRDTEGSYHYAPPADTTLEAEQVLIVVVALQNVRTVQLECSGEKQVQRAIPTWQRLPFRHVPISLPNRFASPEAAAQAVDALSNHYIICGGGRVLQRVLDRLDPARPFVVVCPDAAEAAALHARGFHVVEGQASDDAVLRRAGVTRALAIMVTIEDKAESVLTVLTSRGLNRDILITATAASDDLVGKLTRAGADHVLNPFAIAARSILLATLQPNVYDFLQSTLHNRHLNTETTELYMQDNSPWIGRALGDLRLPETYQANVLAIRQTNGDYSHVPPANYILAANEILIVVAPMQHTDTLRALAHGSETTRPRTLR